MSISIAHLGPPGTYAEQAAISYINILSENTDLKSFLCPYPTIAQTLRAVAQGQAELAVVPIENSIEGGVTMTLDTLWQLEDLQIQLALILPIVHTFISCATSLEEIKTVYSHPQGLAQCQVWLEQYLPNVQLIAANSTTEALEKLDSDLTAGAISSQRAAHLYNLPIMAKAINDRPENCTRFWVVSKGKIPNKYPVLGNGTSRTSLALSIPADMPGSLAKQLQVFANKGINLTRIESRPTKLSLGTYVFFIDVEGDRKDEKMQSALAELDKQTEILKIFGSYQSVEL
jgi:prephenate dehydratase